MAVTGTGEYERVRIVLPFSQWEELRFDGPARPGLFSIRSVELISDRESLLWEGDAVAEVLLPTNQITVIGSDYSGGILYRSNGTDPQFNFGAEAPDPLIFGGMRLLRLGLALFLTFAVLVLFGAGVLFMRSVWVAMRDEGGPLSGRRGYFVAGAVGFTVILYFAFGVQAEKDPVPQHMAGHNLYFHLTEAFLHGHLSLLEEPVQPLRELENPFDPEVNARLRLHDASYFNEKYYVYFGPAPVLTLYLPWRILTGTDLPDRWADGFLLSGAYLFLLFLFLRVRQAFPGRMGNGPLAVGVLGLGLTTGALYLMSRSVVYEVALGSAFFWTAAALLFTFEGLGRKRLSALLVASGFSLGMAMASRHSFVLAGAWIVGVVLLYLLLVRGPLLEGVQRMMALAIPAGIIGVLLLLHNVARFGDPLEFGHNFQIGVVDPHTVSFLDSANFFYNTVINLFQPPAFYASFPWIYTSGEDLLTWMPRPDSHIRVEGAIGLFITNPYLILIPFLGIRPFLRGEDRRSALVLILVGGLALLNFAVIALFSYSSPRYVLDYLPWLVLFFCLLWSVFRSGNSSGPWGRILGIILLLSMIWSISLHFGLALQRIL